MSETHLLPPKGHRARGLALAFLICAPVLVGVLALALGQDANWDLRNYHFYNAYAFLNGRYGFDLLPSQTPYFYNPVMDVPFYVLATHLPARFVSFVLGFVQGLNAVLLFMLAYATLLIPNPRHKVLICAALAALGMLGGGGIALIGTTFGDNMTSIGIFASALLVVKYFDQLFPAAQKDWKRGLGLAVLCGVPAGLMVGLKLPSVVFCVGLCGALLLVRGTWQRRFTVGFAFGTGVLAGAVITYGYWGWFLQSHFQSPFFPYFNGLFKSPLAPLTSARDTQYVQRGLHDILLFPFIFADSPWRTGEIPWRDWRIPILYALLPLALVLRLFFGRTRKQPDAIARPGQARYLLWAAVIGYAVWLGMFAIYRYVVLLEMLTPLLIVLAAGMLPLRLQTRGILAGLILIVVAASIQPGNWTRRDAWLDRFVEAKIPPLGDTSNLMILMGGYEPYSHLVTLFPPEIPFIRIQSNFAGPDEAKGFNKIIRARIEGYKGRMLMLIPPWQHQAASEGLAVLHLAFAPEPCQTVVDRLYLDKPMDLCRIIRK